jgi:hypothetical protein
MVAHHIIRFKVERITNLCELLNYFYFIIFFRPFFCDGLCACWDLCMYIYAKSYLGNNVCSEDIEDGNGMDACGL